MSTQNRNNTTGKVFHGLKNQSMITITIGILEIISFSILSRILSQEDFGYYAIVTAVTVILQTITEAGMGSSVIQKKDPTETYVNTAFSLSFLIGLFSSLFLLFTASFFSRLMIGTDGLTLAFRFMSIPLFLSNINSIARALMIRKLDFLRYGLLQIIAFIISHGVGIFIASMGYGYYAMIALAIIGQLMSTLLLYFHSQFIPKICINKCEAKKILIFGGWLTGSAIVRSITEQLDKFILSHWMSVTTLGAFNRPSGFVSRTTNQINGIFDTVLYPIISRIQNDKEKIGDSYRICVVLISMFSSILLCIFLLGSKCIIISLFGEKWLDLTVVFQIMVLSIVAICYNRIADVFFRATGAVRLYFWNRVFTCVLTIASLYIGCQFGIVGAAIGLAISKYIDLSVKIVMFRKIINLNNVGLFKQILEGCCCPFILLLLCAPFLLLEYGSLISVFLYGVLIVTIIVLKPELLGEMFIQYVYPQISIVINKLLKK